MIYWEETVRELWQSDKSVNEIGRICDISRKTIEGFAKREKLGARQYVDKYARRGVVNPDLFKSVWNNGDVTLNTLTVACGCCPESIKLYLKRNGLSVAPRFIWSEEDVKAIILAHTMGNPVEFGFLPQLCKERGIYLIEDCCEAVGGAYLGKKLGTFGDLGTYSFYPAHQITALGGGGMVVTDNEKLYKKMILNKGSFRSSKLKHSNQYAQQVQPRHFLSVLH